MKVLARVVHTGQGLLQSFIGLGGVVCGSLMIVQPDGGLLQMPVALLKGSPFSDYLVPGILLFTVNGAGSLFAAFLSFRRHRHAGYGGIFFGFALVIWIFVQVSMIGGGHWLQYLYFTLGVVEILTGIAIRELGGKGA